MRVITCSFPDHDKLTLYPIADLHLGAQECMEKEFSDYIKKIADDETAAVILAGDLINNGIKSSVTDVYDEKYTPREQKHLLIDLLQPIKHKIVCAVPGNHEYRTIKETSIDITEDICRELQVEAYSPDIAFLKISVGMKPNKKPATYVFCVTHGAGGGQLLGSVINKPDAFQAVVEGVDGIISGHTHRPAKMATARLVMDSRNNNIIESKRLIFVCTAWLKYGGYPTRKLLRPCAFSPDTITLSGTGKHWQ